MRCEIDQHRAKTMSVTYMASIIVHEATHGFPCLLKFGYPENLRHRIERICIRQQLDFARKCGDDQLCDQIERLLRIKASHWSNESFQERKWMRGLEALKTYGVPIWLAKTLVWGVKKINHLRYPPK